MASDGAEIQELGKKPPGDATMLLGRISDGDQAAANELFPLVYEELRARAGAYFRGQPANHTLQPTALVHDAYVRLVNAPSDSWQGRAHFCAVAARAMRQILINHAKRRAQAQRARGDMAEATLMHTPSSNITVDLLCLDDALAKLADLNENRARLVELRFFGGLTVDEVATALGTPKRTVEREWRSVRAWLQMEMSGGNAP